MEIKTNGHPWIKGFLTILKILLHESLLDSRPGGFRDALWVYYGQWGVSFVIVNSTVQNKLIN